MSKSNIFFTGIIAVLVIIILLQRSCTPAGKLVKTEDGEVLKTDTTYITVDKVVTKTITRVKHDTVPQPGDTVFTPAPGYDDLKAQYESLAKLYSARNIYKDTIKLDSIGYIALIDTVQYNQLDKRKYHYNYSIPVVTKYVQNPPRRQVYIGGGIAMNTVLVPQVQAGLLYKNKKDQIFGIYSMAGPDLVPSFGVSTYWKISFRKK